MTNEMKHILNEDGHVAGGYRLQTATTSTVSNGEYRLIDGKAKYFPDWTETEQI